MNNNYLKKLKFQTVITHKVWNKKMIPTLTFSTKTKNKN